MFDPSRTDIAVPLGSTELWQLVNYTPELHVFHIHQLHFQVISRDNVPLPFTGYTDTVIIEGIDLNGSPGRVNVVLPFTNNGIVGRFLYHCHIMRHEDNGMMATIQLYDPALQTAPPTANNVLPTFTPGPGSVVQVQVAPHSFVFQPLSVTVHVGDTVQWIWTGSNTSSMGHSVTSGNTQTCHGDGLFDSGIKTNGSWIWVPESVGNYTYFCVPHCQLFQMAGSILVLPAAASQLTLHVFLIAMVVLMIFSAL